MTSLDRVPLFDDDLFMREVEEVYENGELVAYLVHAPGDLVPPVRLSAHPLNRGLARLVGKLSTQQTCLERTREARRRRVERENKDGLHGRNVE